MYRNLPKKSKPRDYNYRCRNCGSLDISFFGTNIITQCKCNFCGSGSMEIYPAAVKSMAQLQLEGDRIYYKKWLEDGMPGVKNILVTDGWWTEGEIDPKDVE